jgi:two-component system NtrC family sensor kinase
VSGPDDLDRRTAPGSSSAPVFDWPRLIASETPASVLEELARRLGRGAVELLLESTEPSTGLIAEWRSDTLPRGERRRHTVTVAGRPPWRLTLTSVVDTASPGEPLDRAGLALEAWREAQLELGRAESRLALRTRELDLIQTLGRRAAEARTARDLFTAVLAVLQQGEDLDLALVADTAGEALEVTAHLARPVEEACLVELAMRATRLLGGGGASPDVRCEKLETFDPGRGERATFEDEELVVLPILRRDRAVACLLLLPAKRPQEAHLRLFYSAANQLCLHLDRILTVREAEADRFRSILDSMPQAVLLADRELRLLQLNRAASAMVDELGLGERRDLGPLVERLGIEDAIRRVRDRGLDEADAEARLDAERILDVTVTPLAGESSRADGLVLVITDVSESRRLQQQLAHSEKMSSLGQMISGVAHELNNPLASIMGYAQLLHRAAADETVERRAAALDREAERCQKIVRSLLSFARRREPERRPLSLNEVVQSVRSLMGYQLRVDDVELRTDLSTDLPPLLGDAHELQQVLVNLLTNARQAIRNGDGSGTITVSTKVDDTGAILLEVRDSGPGIPEEIRSKIFDPFFTTKAEGQGTGLGLSLVFGIVNAHGGTIEALPATASSAGGATLRVRFPAAGLDGPADDAGQPRDDATPARPGRILVVDDEQPLARMICDALAEDGHAAEHVCDGAQALEKVGQQVFDLVVSDLRMPGMGGERLFEEIRRRRPELARRLLLTTGDTVRSDPQRVAERTGLAVLQKPFDLDRLRRLVRARLAGDE